MFPVTTRILIVDDMKGVRTLERAVLGELGYKNVLEAGSGQEALDIIRKQASGSEKIELVLTDWKMPDVSGMELLTTIRGDRLLKDLPIIFVTAESEKNKILEALKEKVNDYLVKPFNASTLERKFAVVWKKLFESGGVSLGGDE